MDKQAAETGSSFEKHVGRVMAKFRSLRNYTQDRVGIDLNVSGRTVGKYENSKLPITAATMAAVSQICNFDLIEYILFDDLSLAQKFKGIVKGSRINPYGHALQKDVRRLQDDDYLNMSYIDDSQHWRNDDGGKKPRDFLYDFPPTHPLPICKEDEQIFIEYLSAPSNKDLSRFLLYGYELLRLHGSMGSSVQTISAFSKQILRRLIKDGNGDFDQVIYDYYWKCLYSR